MYKKINLSVSSGLMVGLLITGCSQQPANLSDIQSIPVVIPTPINVVKPVAPKAIHQPRPPRMIKPIQRMVKPVQRMSKPIQRQY